MDLREATAMPPNTDVDGILQYSAAYQLQSWFQRRLKTSQMDDQHVAVPCCSKELQVASRSLRRSNWQLELKTRLLNLGAQPQVGPFVLLVDVPVHSVGER